MERKMSTVRFTIFISNIIGGMPEGWPDHVEYFEREVKLSFLPDFGMKVSLGSSQGRDLRAEVMEVTYDLPADTFTVDLEMERRDMDTSHFLNAHNGWKANP
jgi:hypothetical protein